MRGLWVLWGGEFASRVGESFFQIALLWYLVETAGSNLEVGTITMIGYLPALVVGIWAGVIVDRLDYRRVMLTADGLRALTVLAIPLLYLAGALPLPMVAALAFGVTSCSAFFNPARDAIIPRLAGPERLLFANSLVQSAWQFSLLLGPFLAAVLLGWLETVHLFFAVSLFFALSLAILVALPRDRELKSETSPPPSSGRGSFAAEFRAGLAYLRRERRIFWIWAITVINNFFLMGPVIIGMPIYVKSHLGGDGADFALIEGVYALGMIVSTWLIARYGRRWNPVRMLLFGLIWDGLTYVPMVWLTSVEETALLVLIHSLGIPTITISRLTALHRLVPPEMRGRVFSYFHLAVSGMTALSIGAVGLALTWIPVNELFGIIGLLCAATGLFGLMLRPLREPLD